MLDGKRGLSYNLNTLTALAGFPFTRNITNQSNICTGAKAVHLVIKPATLSEAMQIGR